MIIPSIDIMTGTTVQLIGGETKALEAGDPRAVARRFSLVGELAVIDLDAARNEGSNASIIEELVTRYQCRVGGGIRDYETAVRWLDAGAANIIIGTAASPELLRRLPRDRIIAALDCRHGEVVVDGWRTGTGRPLEERLVELRDFVGGFLVTFVELEGRMEGIDLDAVRAVRECAGDTRLTVAGGITTAEEIRALDQLGIDAQVGMALYTERLDLSEAFLAPATPGGPDTLWPTVVVDENQVALGLAWSDRESVRQALQREAGVYHSRKRGLWVKGETSGDTQELLRMDLDCDRDALRFTVRQRGQGFCHTGTRTCWGADIGLNRLHRRLRERAVQAPGGSYTRRLMTDPGLLDAKLREEAEELIEAKTPGEITSEAADLIYFALVKTIAGGSSLEEVARKLDRRERRVTRRPGDAKPKGRDLREQ